MPISTLTSKLTKNCTIIKVWTHLGLMSLGKWQSSSSSKLVCYYFFSFSVKSSSVLSFLLLIRFCSFIYFEEAEFKGFLLIEYVRGLLVWIKFDICSSFFYVVGKISFFLREVYLSENTSDSTFCVD